MSKLLILANDYKTIANFRMEILHALLQSGYELTLSLPDDARNTIFTDMGCRICPTNISRHGTNPVKELKLLRFYRRLLQQEQPDVVLTYTVKPNIYGSLACAKLHIPVINNVTGLGSVLQKGGLMSKLMLWLQKKAFRHSACVFFQNRENLDEFRRAGIVGEQAALLPGSGVNLQLHAPMPYPSEREHTDFIVVSRLRQDKGFDEFFEMTRRILPKYPNVRFHIVGWLEEERYRWVTQERVDSEQLIYHGEKTQREVHELLAQSHCIVHPSYHEGMANVLMEAAAAGRPALASDIPGCREVIDDGVTGFTFTVKDADALTAAVERFLQSDEKTHEAMGKAGRRKMEADFDRNIVIRLYKQKINTIIASKMEESANVRV